MTEESKPIAVTQALKPAVWLEQEPVAYQYRWTNPGNNPHAHPSETEWKPVELKHCKTIPEEAAQLARYRYDGKPSYEVRELYAATPRREPLSDEQVGMLTVFDGLHHIETPLLAEYVRFIESAVRKQAGWE
jgi:hypothetical protein